MSTLSPPAPATTQVELPRVLNLRDLVLFNIVAILSLRWTATAAAAGPSSLTMWVIAALLFFIPMGLAVSYLAAGPSAPSGRAMASSAAGRTGSITSCTTPTC